MFSFRRTQTDAPKKTESDKQRVERECHEVSKKLLEYYCSNIGFLPRDVQPYLEGYQACRKVWKGMSMSTIYNKFNDPKILPTIIWLDCRMSDEEMAKIDEMDLVTVDAFIRKESKARHTAFVRASPLSKDRVELQYLREKAKYCLRLSVDEIAAKGSFIDMARYWCHVRPESWGAGTRGELMRLFKGVD